MRCPATAIQEESRERVRRAQGSWKYPESCWEPLWGTETESGHSTVAPSPFRTDVFGGHSAEARAHASCGGSPVVQSEGLSLTTPVGPFQGDSSGALKG